MQPVRGSAEREGRDAAERIVQSAVRRIVASGAHAVTMHEVAQDAGVSKGLIHYHFQDKETLIAVAVDWMTRALVAREERALASSSPRSAIEDLWGWLWEELARGEIRVLLELAEWRAPIVRRATVESAVARRAAATASVERLFALMALRPRVPARLLADVVVAFTDGLVLAAALDQGLNPRAAFDVFWLSLLSLGE